MSGRRITLVLGVVIVLAFGYIGYSDAVRTWQNLQNQKNQIDNLNAQSDRLDKKLDNTRQKKTERQAEVDKLERKKNKLEKKRQKLKSDLKTALNVTARFGAYNV